MNSDTVRQKPRIKKENGVWVCCYITPWDSEESYTDEAKQYKLRVIDSLRLCEILNAKNPA